MGEPKLFQLAIFIISAIAFILLMTSRKQVERGTELRAQANIGRYRKIEPSYCFNDCMRTHGDSKDIFCGVACGIRDEQK
jgi:hypothetical protein